MPQTTASRYCPHCKDRTLAIRNTPNHTFHLVLSVLTAGVWAVFVWLPVALLAAAGSYRCNRCGTAV